MCVRDDPWSISVAKTQLCLQIGQTSRKIVPPYNWSQPKFRGYTVRTWPRSTGENAMSPTMLMLLLLTIGAVESTDVAPIVHYSFERGSGSTVHDDSGNGHDAQIKGQATRMTGPWGTALQLDGHDGFVDCGQVSRPRLDESGSVVFWFKPESVCQGGLLNWTQGSEQTDQRVVMSLNTYRRNKGRGARTYRELGVYFMNGKDTHEVHASNFYKPYFPKPDQWLFMALTFDGQTVNVYRDGVLVYSRFQSMVPQAENLSLWIGRCVGMGGTSDYFRGVIDEVRLFDRPLSDQGVFALYMKDAELRDKDTTGFGSIRITAKSYPRPGWIFADLDYRGLQACDSRPQIRTELLDPSGNVVATGNTRMSPLWGRAEVLLDVSQLPLGTYQVRAAGDQGDPGVAEVEWPGRAEGWQQIKVLNNFCWELLNVTGEKAAATHSFVNPRRGWVFFQSDADAGVAVSGDGAAPSMIRTSQSGHQEAMRWLPAGEHSIRVAGDGSLGRLVVRVVPTLAFGHYPHVGPGTGDDYEFLSEHVLPHVNTLITGGRYPYDHMNQRIDRWVSEHGGHWIQIIYRPKVPTDRKQMRQHLTSALGMKDPFFHGVIIDEFDPGDQVQAWIQSHYDEWIEVMADILKDPQYADHMTIPYCAYNMFDYDKSSAFIRNLVEHDAYFAWEVYLHEHQTEAAAALHIHEGLADLMDDWEQPVPGAAEKMIVTLSYLEREPWNTSADFKVFMDMQWHHLATRPEFFGLAGVEEYVSHHATEEYIRWAAKLARHYGLTGNSERLSPDPYTLRHIKDGDFVRGAEAWQINAAESDSVGIKNYPGYGVLQERYPHRDYTDSSLLWTRRSAEGPNSFSQVIEHLQPGRLYSVKLTTGDYQQLLQAEAQRQVHAVAINIDNVEMHSDWYRTDHYEGEAEIYKTWRTVGPFNGENRYWMNVHRRVFRAKDSTARLTISDWASDADPGGPIGQELIFNAIEVEPYLE